jgi:restriction system protein
MAIWLVRAGRSGEYENKFLTESLIYLTWGGLNYDLSTLKAKADVHCKLAEVYPEEKTGTVRNWTGQVNSFVHEIKKGDWVVLPSKIKSAIHFAVVTGDYQYNHKAEDPYYHFRKVEWFAQDIPRSNFDQDILYSLGAFLTVCRITRNDAESRIKAMYKNQWKTPGLGRSEDDRISQDASYEFIDLEEYSRDKIAKRIIQKFKGHGMAILIEEILKAKGYVTFRSPEGPDKGVDILAAPEPLGFGKPRLCVQVKTSDVPIDRPTLDQLLGSMQNFHAEQGLLVSWGGFKSSVDKEKPSQFFRIRLWDQKDIINELVAVYDNLDVDLKAEIPLKRIWTWNDPED